MNDPRAPQTWRLHAPPGGARSVVRYLASPHSGLLGQLVRWGLAGGLVALLYLTVTTLLSQLAGLPFELALAIGFVCALMLHFTLQREFVWMHEAGFALRMGPQVRRYLLMAGTQYGITAASTALLPSALGVATELVYLATMAIVTTAGFLLMRFAIFHGSPADTWFPGRALDRHGVQSARPHVDLGDPR